MSKYKVNTIAIAVKNNRIAKFGETVADSELTVNAEELIKSGAISLIDSETATETVVEVAAPEAVVEETAEVATEEVVAEEDAPVVEKELSKKDKVKAALAKK